MSENTQEINQNHDDQATLSGPESLMLSANLTACEAAMNWNNDNVAVSVAEMGAALVDMKNSSPSAYAEFIKDKKMSADSHAKAIRWYRAFPEILLPTFEPGANAAVNIALRKHPDNPADKLLDNLLHSIENHPDFKE
ncbi:MAG: hypothetical protein PHT88_04635 [Candidatus Moranbacteria bacterium]|nr:hypothetical protein [Candidatus Moranbacteria bacterium]